MRFSLMLSFCSYKYCLFLFQGNLNELGKLLMQGSFNVWIDHKKGHSKVKDLARFKPMQRHLFLHEKAVLFCKKREENGEGYEKAPSYSYKHSLNVRHGAVRLRYCGLNSHQYNILLFCQQSCVMVLYWELHPSGKPS